MRIFRLLMLSLILFPLLVIVALSVLLYLFFRRLPEVETRLHALSGDRPAPFLSIGDWMKRFFLGVIERLARSFKLFSLKVHNQLNVVAAHAREARLRAAARMAERRERRLSTALPDFSSRGDSPSSVSSPLHSEDVKESVSEKRRWDKERTTAFHSVSSFPEKRESESPSPLRRWFGAKGTAEKMNSGSTPSAVSSSEEPFDSERGKEWKDEVSADDAPLVSEPIPPANMMRDESMIRRRAADISRRFGDALQKFQVERKPKISEREDVPEITKKSQLEDILVERISMNPRDIEAYERLGDYYLEQKNLTDAKECYRQVLKLSPAYRLVKIKIRRLERLLEKER